MAEHQGGGRVDTLTTRGRPPTATGDGSTPARTGLYVVLAAALGAVSVLTLTPEGTGWAWGSLATEVRWYAAGLDSASTMLQLAGNLGLLVVPAGCAVLLWPSLGTPLRLTGAALAAGASIELLQGALALGRVVSPLDALLNATGAVAAGLLVVHVARSARGALPCAGRSRPAAARR